MVDYLKFENSESIWRDYQRWRETLGIIVIAEIPKGVESNIGKAMDKLGITKIYQDIWESNRLVLNSSLIVICQTDQMEISGSFAENTHFCFLKDGKFEETQILEDLEKLIWQFFNVIVERIDEEAANFADSKNEGLIITLADINVDENFTTMTNRRTCRKLKSAADMLLLRGNLQDAHSFYEKAIDEGIIASDSLWIAGALLGKASINALVNDDKSDAYNPEIHMILKECHEQIIKTKITELEVEISLIYARYLKQFPQWKEMLVNLVSYMTRHDLKRLRKREKGHYYYQLAQIWKDSGFMRKYSWFLVYASHYLNLKKEHKDLQIQFFQQALNEAYGLNFLNFNINYEENAEQIKKLSNDITSRNNKIRFECKPKNKSGGYRLIKNK